MPIKIDSNLPAHKLLENENIFVMTEERAVSQDIRPLKILILNLMPTKIETETQILRLLSNSPIQVEAELLQTATHEVKNVSKEHMFKFYKTFSGITYSISETFFYVRDYIICRNIQTFNSPFHCKHSCI